MDLSIKNMTKINSIREKLSGSFCTRCPLHGMIRDKGYYPIPSRGTGRIMFVGLAPSPEEHITGMAFRGHPGSFLKYNLQQIAGLNIDTDCYLTNIVKCHPEEVNAKFKVQYKRNCSFYFNQEYHAIKPPIVIFFSQESYFAVGYRDTYPGPGVPFKIDLYGNDQWVMVMDVPALMLKDESRKKTFITQLKGLTRWLNEHLDFYNKRGIPVPSGIEQLVSRNILVDTPGKAAEMIHTMEETLKDMPRKYVAIDTETTGLDLYHPDFRIVGASFAVSPEIGYYIPVGHRHLPGALLREPIAQLSEDMLRRIILKLLQTNKWVPVFHNFYYDYRVLKKLGIPEELFAIPNNPYHDSYILAYLNNENDLHGLKSQAFVHLNRKPRSFSAVAGDNTFEYVDTKTACEYAGDDATNTLGIYFKLRSLVADQSTRHTGNKLMRRIYPSELAVTKLMADATDTGIRIDIDYMKALSTRLEAEEQMLFEKLDSICNTINHTSSFQLGLLIDRLLNESDKSAKENKMLKSGFYDTYGDSADEATINQVKKYVVEKSQKGSKFTWSPERLSTYVDTLFKHRKVAKIRSTYVNSIIEKLVQDGDGNYILHGQFKTLGTTSGRMSSQSPNLQNLPRSALKPPQQCMSCGLEDEESIEESGDKLITVKKTWYEDVDETGGIYICRNCHQPTHTFNADIRKAFIARPGKVFVVADYDAMEMAVAAAVSGDDTLVGIINGARTDPDNPNYDMHRVTASKVYNCTPAEVTKEQRQNVKAVNFGCVYGIAAPGLQVTLRSMGINVTVQEAESMIEDGFFAAYPGVRTWFNKCRMKIQSDHFLVHPYGRIRHTSERPTSEEIRSATNFIIQGWCASIVKQALDDIVKKLKESGLFETSKIVTVIHDEIVIETQIEQALEVADIMKSCMNVTIKDEAAVRLNADPEFVFNLSKGAHHYSVAEFQDKFIKRSA